MKFEISSHTYLLFFFTIIKFLILFLFLFSLYFRRPLSTVSNTSKEISDTGSSVEDYSESDHSEGDKYEHRPTLTGSSIISPINKNS